MNFSKDIFDVIKRENCHKHKRKHDHEVLQDNCHDDNHDAYYKYDYNDHAYNPNLSTNTQQIRIFCPQCLTEVNPTSKLCPDCGKKLMIMLCQNCGSNLTVGANFCSNCGIKIKYGTNR